MRCALMRDIALALTLVAFAQGARAEEPAADALERARAHYEVARGLYRLGNYSEAAKEFAAGYHLAPKPDFLINLGQCYRRLKDYPQAAQMFDQYLAESPADDPNRAQVHQLAAEVAAERAAARSPSTEGTVPAPQVALATPRPAAPGRLRHLWWIVPTATVVIAGVAVGIYLGVRGSAPTCLATDVACLDLR